MEKEKIVVIEAKTPQFETEEEWIILYWWKEAPPELKKQWEENWNLLNDEAKKAEIIKNFEEENKETEEGEKEDEMGDVLAAFDELSEKEPEEDVIQEYEPDMNIIMEWIFTIKKSPTQQKPNLKRVWALW